jgi:sarcosine reductase
VAFGGKTSFESGLLTVDRDAALHVVADPVLGDVRLSWASPGESVRIAKVLDSVEPRTKGRPEGVFPGWLSPARAGRAGDTHVLRGAAVVAAGYLPRAQEGVVDMSGPAAALTPLGLTHNLVIEFGPGPQADWEEVDAALRRGTLTLAAYLARAAMDAAPDSVEEVPSVAESHSGDLPRVGAITNIQTQGSFKDVFVYGRSFANSMPTLISQGDLDDGALVSGQYGHPGLKNPTYLYQNHPVAEELRRRHGKDLTMAGVVVCPEPVDQDHKELISALAAQLCKAAGFDAAVVTKEGGGNADADVALKMDLLEDLGVTAVGVFAEMAGPDGTAPSLVVAPTKATAMVSTGNYDQKVQLPAVEQALGAERVDLVDSPVTSELELPMAALYCSLSPLGWGRLTCREASQAGEHDR